MKLCLLYQLKSADPAFLEGFYPLRRLRQACQERSVDFSLVLAADAAKDFESFARTARGGRVLLRGDLSDALLERLHDSGLDCVNSPAAIAATRDKKQCYEFLARRKVAFPALLPPEDYERLVACLPLIAKPRRGMMGRGVTLVEDPAELARILPAASSGDMLFQEYIKESRGRDYRVFCCRGRVLAQARRESSGLLSNAHQGGLTSACELPSHWTKLALKILDAAGLEYGAVDYLERGPDDLLVCEVNACPGFEALEGATGVDVAGAILDACLGSAGSAPYGEAAEKAIIS